MLSELGLGILWYVVFVVSTTFHEAAHGFAALKFGDTTARDFGLVTLDPVAHIRRSPFGMVIVPVISFLFGGWMFGWASTPYDRYWAQRHGKKATLMALAGPAANLALILIAAVIIRGGMFLGVFIEPEVATSSQITTSVSLGMANGAAILVSIVLSLNLILFVFNLLPVPPLDGSEVIPLFVKAGTAQRYREFMAEPASQILGLVVAWHIMDFIIDPAQTVVLNLLYPGAGYY